jgi:hypothetical protein
MINWFRVGTKINLDYLGRTQASLVTSELGDFLPLYKGEPITGQVLQIHGAAFGTCNRHKKFISNVLTYITTQLKPLHLPKFITLFQVIFYWLVPISSRRSCVHKINNIPLPRIFKYFNPLQIIQNSSGLNVTVVNFFCSTLYLEAINDIVSVYRVITFTVLQHFSDIWCLF